MADEVNLHFQLQLNTSGFLIVPTYKKSNGLRSGEREGCTSKTVGGHILVRTFVRVMV